MPDGVKHTFDRSDSERGRRKQVVVEHWKRCIQLGRGASAIVWLETKVHNGLKEERAVKEIRKTSRLPSQVKYYEQEVLAIAKLSKVRLGRPLHRIAPEEHAS